MTLAFGPQLCGTLDESSRREWLVTDGLGGYAMGTVAGLRTRRYHALLVTGGMVGLTAVDAVLVAGDARFRLACDEWSGGTVDPPGHEYLVSFGLVEGVPRWRWQIGALVLERELAMSNGSPTVGVVHRLVAADRPVRLELTPLCTWRGMHGERHAYGAPEIAQVPDGFLFEHAYRVQGAGWQSGGGGWYSGVRLREEAARGLNDVEDVFAPGTFSVALAPGERHELTASATKSEARLPPAALLVTDARLRAATLTRRARSADDVDAQLVLAADQFVVSANGRPTAFAGYPWFGEWSRDLMTSYEGLFLATNRWDEGRAVLREAAGTLSEGMLANTADTGTLEYNTVDGTLWFVHALDRHVAVTGDDDLGGELGGELESIVRSQLDGTRFGIRADTDGLITQGADGWALTWMDARVDGVPVTPRRGKPVEVNALWVRALATAARFVPSSEVRSTCESVGARARESFVRRFVRPDGLGLFDVVDGPAGDDASIRPNQLLGASLLDPGTAARVVAVCRDALLTPLGLRSLAPSDPRYCAHHRGSPAERDAAYHQGTVWPWLIGPYVDAATVAGTSTVDVLGALAAHLVDWGVGSVSETADGAAPHAGTGCPFQAWSVAELLRVRSSS
jgi:predicted glycogen debranching enzyme